METDRLVIRGFFADDWKDLHEYLSQPETVKYEPYRIFTEEQSRIEAAKRAENDAFWAVCLKDTGKMIGNLYMADQGFDTYELGYVFNAKYLGNGYATEAARALIDSAFNEKRAHRIIANCNPKNERSWKLLERLGMRKEGTLLKNIYFERDKQNAPIWQDTVEYAVLRTEWLQRDK